MNYPRFEHDCEDCIFLGIRGSYDLYYCPSGPTILARSSDDPEDYSSGMTFAKLGYEPYATGLKLAQSASFADKDGLPITTVRQFGGFVTNEDNKDMNKSMNKDELHEVASTLKAGDTITVTLEPRNKIEIPPVTGKLWDVHTDGTLMLGWTTVRWGDGLTMDMPNGIVHIEVVERAPRPVIRGTIIRDAEDAKNYDIPLQTTLFTVGGEVFITTEWDDLTKWKPRRFPLMVLGTFKEDMNALKAVQDFIDNGEEI